MTINEALNPFRLHANWFEFEYLLQEDEESISIVKTKKTKRVKSKCVVLFEGSEKEFINTYDKETNSLRTAFKNIIYQTN